MANFESFETAIKAYLDELAKTDKLFAKTYAKENKSLDECCKYIMAEAKKAAKGKAQIALKDEDVYNLAVHYYDEDDIKATEEVQGEVVVAEKKPKAKATPTEKRKETKRKKVAEPEPTDEEEVENDYELEIPIF